MFSLMGNCCSCIKSRRQPKRAVTLAILGLDSAGKTTTTKAFLGESVDGSNTAPTIGFDKQEFTFANYEITLYDLGGGRKIRNIWKNYLSEIYGIVYVVDSAAPERFPEVKESLEDLLSHEKVKEKPLLVLANKEDISDHVDEVDIMEKIDLERLVNENRCYSKMQMCSAIKGTGRKMDPNIKVGMQWLCGLLDQLYEKLKLRVDKDIEELERQRQIEREERKERVRKQREEREKKEEEERKRLGIEKEEEVDEDDDIVGGSDPFKRLDSEEIKRKEEKYKNAKAKEKERKQKLKELEELELSQKTSIFTTQSSDKTNNNNIDDDDEDGLRAPRSSRSLLGLTWLNGGLSNGHPSPGRDGQYSERYNQRSARQILPPLEDSPASLGGNKEKKGNKKLKNRVGVNENTEIDNDSFMNFNTSMTSSVSRIQVESVHQDDEDSDTVIPVLGIRRDPFRKSQGRYKQDEDNDYDSRGQSNISSKKKGKKKKQTSLSSDNDDDFDTLRLSQHLEDVNELRIASPDTKPSLSNGHVERSNTPVKKLKKKNKLLRKNRIQQSDDEFELSDAQSTPKKRPIPWVNSPKKSVNVDSDEEKAHTNWGMAEDLSGDEINPIRRTRPNVDSDDEPVL